MPDVRLLAPEEWFKLRDIRLTALRESPDAFLSTFEHERSFGEDRWRAELARGDWSIGEIEGRPISLLGTTREPGAPDNERLLEYLWVASDWRRFGVAFSMLTAVLDRLRTSGVQTVFLWVLDDNDIAMRLYKRVGFSSSNHRQPLAARPGRSEERLRLDLA